MRIFALFLCLFLLLISFGTLTYIYILWNTYWMRVAKLSEERNYLRQQQQQNSVRVLEGDDDKVRIFRYDKDAIYVHLETMSSSHFVIAYLNYAEIS